MTSCNLPGSPNRCEAPFTISSFLVQMISAKAILFRVIASLSNPPTINKTGDTTRFRSWIPARIYDYIGNNSRIICLASVKSEVSLLLKKYQKSVRLFYEESEEVRVKKLRNFMSEYNCKNEVSDEFIQSFSRKKLTMRLSDLFYDISND